jgi:DNA-directed RNA polymerase specialized sigma24 family protein
MATGTERDDVVHELLAAVPDAAGGRGKAAWTDAVELGLDVAKAISEARRTGRLTAEHAAIVLLIYFRGCTMEEVAEILHMSGDQVYRRHRSALEAIRSTGSLDGYASKETGRGS